MSDMIGLLFCYLCGTILFFVVYSIFELLDNLSKNKTNITAGNDEWENHTTDDLYF